MSILSKESQMIPLLKPSCTQAEIDAVTEVLKSGWWGQGPKCDEFERRIADIHGYRFAVTVNSATAALHLALLTMGVGPGEEVIVPALTFVSTALAVTYTGAKPLFADVYPDTLTIDWNDVDRLMKTHDHARVVIPVDYAGYPALVPFQFPSHMASPDMIQDAAHSCGGVAYGDLVCFSFHPVKNLATGDGGCILTNNGAAYSHLKELRWCGISRSTYDRIAHHYNWDYDIHEVGYKCHWNDIQAAIGLVQLNRMNDLLLRRTEIAHRYRECLNDVVQLQPYSSNHTNHLFPIRVESSKRDKILDYLLDHGISAGVHYKPLTHYDMYKDQATPRITEREWSCLISLPIFYDMTDDQVEHVIQNVKEAVNVA